jgi:hypothetical protein
MDEAWIATLKSLRDQYVERLNAKIELPGRDWPETEAYLREALLELSRELRAAEEALRKKNAEDTTDGEVEVISQGFT